MRTRLLSSGASMAVVAALAAVLAAVTIDNTYEERLDDLEARVSRLEAEIGVAPSTSGQDGADGQDGRDGEDGEDGADVTIESRSSSSSVSSSSSSSTSSSVQDGTRTYTATHAANGDRSIPMEIDEGGTYRFTVEASSGLTLVVEDAHGDEIEVLRFEADDEEALSGTADLEPGDYTIHVESSSSWVVIVTLLEG